MSKNIFNSMVINTTPGACEGNPFTPPAGFQGDEEKYLQLLRDRFRENPHAQRMQVIALHFHHPEAIRPTRITGPYEFAAWHVISKLRYQQQTVTPKQAA